MPFNFNFSCPTDRTAVLPSNLHADLNELEIKALLLARGIIKDLDGQGDMQNVVYGLPLLVVITGKAL